MVGPESQAAGMVKRRVNVALGVGASDSRAANWARDPKKTRLSGPREPHTFMGQQPTRSLPCTDRRRGDQDSQEGGERFVCVWGGVSRRLHVLIPVESWLR